jgi:uncharacterized protein
MTSMQRVLGSIVSLWRYPVKSMMGEELNAAEVTKDGLLGDRAYALVDSRRAATAEEYWPDIEGLDHRDAVTDIGLPDGTFFRLCLRACTDHSDAGSTTSAVSGGTLRGPTVSPQHYRRDCERREGVHGECLDRANRRDRRCCSPSITGPCARCVTTLPQGDLPKDAGILRTAAQHNHANVGVYASVLQSGKVRRGDSVTLE